MIESCKNCKLYRKASGPEHHRNFRGNCHLQPETIPVRDSHFCGQWRPREPTGWKCINCVFFTVDAATMTKHCVNAHGCDTGAERTYD